ncbi:hypothetical protein MMC28_001077 [Mycoblastus sanguinarius]|nr:hypothetical protein [Mycoblastus sanguinarius]
MIMEEDRSEGAQDVTAQDTHQPTLGSESQENITKGQAEERPNLPQVAHEAPKVADQRNKFTTYASGDVSLDPSASSVPGIQNHAQQHNPNDYPSGPFVTLGVPTASLAAIAGDIATNEDPSRGLLPFPDLEEDSQPSNQNGSPWAVVPNGYGSLESSHQDIAPSIAESEEHQIQAFAKLEFDDGEFYMNTYAVELGRDIQAAREALERNLQARQDSDSKPKEQSGSSGAGSITSDRIKQEDGPSTMPVSIFGDGGGVIGVDRSKSESDIVKKMRRKKSKSSSSSSRQLSRNSSMQFAVRKTDYNALAMASLMDHSAAMNGFAERPIPSPEKTPLIPIHPSTATEGLPTGHKSISRRHIRIAFNFDKHLFQVEIIGRNGGFVDDEWYAPGDIQPLVNGSTIQIGGVGIRFVLPDVPQGETGAEQGMGSDPLSGGNFVMGDSSEPESEEDIDEDEGGEVEDIKNEEVEEEEPEKLRTRGAKAKSKPEPSPPVPKRKGPGRPPKNGVMSKKKLAEKAKKAKEEAKAAAGRGKGKGGKESKDGKHNDTLQPNGKRKYTKRKRVGGKPEDQQGVRESTEHTDSVPPEQGYAVAIPPKTAKDKKPVKPPRSPSPDIDPNTLTPEQLTKPSASYVILIHEALSNSKTGALSLGSIYRAIETRYPYYKFKVTTQGWQSSVRHNLGQNAAFRKRERDGKGWQWEIDPEVSIEKEKKPRRATPPLPQAHYYPPGPPVPQYPYHTGMAPLNGHMPQLPYGIHPGIPPSHMPRAPPLGPSRYTLPLAAQSEATYQSPYQSTPTPRPGPPTPQLQQANGHYPTPLSQTQRPQTSENSRYLAGHGPSPSPAAPRQQQTSPAPSAPPSSSSEQQDWSQAIGKFKKALIDSMDDKERGVALVNSAVSRTIGLSPTLRLEKEDPEERTIMSALASMLGDLSKKNQEAKRQAPDSLPPPVESVPTTGTVSASQRPTAASIAAEIAAKIAVSNDEGSTTEGAAAAEGHGHTKRPLENGDDGVGETILPEAKRVAVV